MARLDSHTAPRFRRVSASGVQATLTQAAVLRTVRPVLLATLVSLSLCIGTIVHATAQDETQSQHIARANLDSFCTLLETIRQQGLFITADFTSAQTGAHFRQECHVLWPAPHSPAVIASTALWPDDTGGYYPGRRTLVVEVTDGFVRYDYVIDDDGHTQGRAIHLSSDSVPFEEYLYEFLFGAEFILGVSRFLPGDICTVTSNDGLRAANSPDPSSVVTGRHALHFVNPEDSVALSLAFGSQDADAPHAMQMSFINHESAPNRLVLTDLRYDTHNGASMSGVFKWDTHDNARWALYSSGTIAMTPLSREQADHLRTLPLPDGQHIDSTVRPQINYEWDGRGMRAAYQEDVVDNIEALVTSLRAGLIPGLAIRKGAPCAPPSIRDPYLSEGLVQPSPLYRAAPSDFYCGLYCLQCAALLLGIEEFPLRPLLTPKYIPTDRGSTFATLSIAAKEHGLIPTAMRDLTVYDLASLSVPAILQVTGNPLLEKHDHYVICFGAIEGEALIYDPPGAIQRVSLASIDARWNGTALLISDTDNALHLFKHDGNGPSC